MRFITADSLTAFVHNRKLKTKTVWTVDKELINITGICRCAVVIGLHTTNARMSPFSPLGVRSFRRVRSPATPHSYKLTFGRGVRRSDWVDGWSVCHKLFNSVSKTGDEKAWALKAKIYRYINFKKIIFLFLYGVYKIFHVIFELCVSLRCAVWR